MTSDVGVAPEREATPSPDVAGAVRRRPTRWTTPALLRVAGVAVVVLLVAVGAAGLLTATDRASTLQDIDQRIGPLDERAATVYRALADADAAVAAEFLGGTADPRALRLRYDGDVVDASEALTTAATLTDDPVTLERVKDLATQLPVYTSLVEGARAGNLREPTAVASYLRRASDLMQTTLLPVADTLQERQAQRLEDAYRRAGAVPVAALTVTLLAAVVVVAVQVGMAVRFHRVLNPGFVIATAALALGVVWWVVAETVSGTYLDQSHLRSRAVSDALVPAQIAALQARASEDLALSGRDVAAHEQDFEDRWTLLARDGGRGGALGASTRLVSGDDKRGYLDTALAAAAEYHGRHARVVQADVAGRRAEAVSLAMSDDDPASAAAAFGQLDRALSAGADAERRSSADQLHGAQQTRAGLAAVSVVVGVVGAAGGVLGVWLRLRQFR